MDVDYSCKHWEVSRYKCFGWQVLFNNSHYKWFMLKTNAIMYAKGACHYFYTKCGEPSILTIKAGNSAHVINYGNKQPIQMDHILRNEF